MNLSEFNDNYFLLGNFNIDLLKYKNYAGTNGFLDSLSCYMSSYMFMLFYPTRVTGHSQTIIDKIFSNYISREAVCGNITSTSSDHLPQVLFTPSMFSENTKSSIF